MKYAAAILCLILASCASKVVVSPITPRATVVNEAAGATAAKATKVKKNTETMGRDIQSLQEEISKARIDAERLKKAGKATQEQLDANAKAWETVSLRNMFLEAAAQNAIIDASELETAAARAKNESALLKAESIKADKTVLDLKTQLEKQSADVARGRMVKHGVWLLIGIAVLYLAIRFLLPLIRPL